MSYKKHVFPSLSLLTVAMSASLYAAQPLNLEEMSLSAVQSDFFVQLPGKKTSLTHAANSMQYLKHRTDKNQTTHTRFQQTYFGYPVFGGYGIIHSKQSPASLLGAPANKKVSMNGVVYKGLEAELGAPNASFIKNGSVALDQFKEKYKDLNIQDAHVAPMVYMDDAHQAHWAYKVGVYIIHEDKIPEHAMAIIDAKTYKPFVEWNDIKTIGTVVKGKGFGGNERTQRYEYGNDRPFLLINRDEASEHCYMENPGVKVVDMEHAYNRPNVPMKFRCAQSTGGDESVFWTGYQADGYDEQNGAYSPTNDALYAGYVINQMYKEWFDLDALTDKGKPMQLIMRVHYGDGYENAFWDGRQMTFGDGHSLMHPLVSLGVGAHEISHGFTEQHSGLMYYGQSGGINEAFSDMAAQAAEFYSERKSSWEIGSEIMKANSGYNALRYMERPSQDGRSIDSADQYRMGLDVHFSSGVYNRLFYLLANTSGWDTKKAFNVMVKANMDYWTPYTTFESGGCGIINATMDLGFSAADVKQALDNVAINYEKCSVAVDALS